MSATRGYGTTAKGITLVYAQILPVMAIVSLFPAIPKLFAQFGGVPNAAWLVPMIVTIPALMVALTSPFAGALADRIGRRRTFQGGMLLYVLAGMVPVIVTDLTLIVASRAVLGIAEAFVVTVSSALIGDYFGEQRHRWVAWVGVSISIAGTVLIAAGGALADIGWRGPFFIYAAAIPGLIMAMLFIDEPAVLRHGDDAAAPRLGYPVRQALLIGAVTLVTSVLYYAEPLHVAQVLTDRGAGSATRVGIIQSATSIAFIFGAIAYRRLHRLPIARHLGIAAAFIGAGQVVIGLAQGYGMVALGATIQQFGAGIIIPSLLAWGQAILPPEQRGRGLGIWVTAFFAGTFLCPPLITALSQVSGGLQPAMVVVGIITLAMFAVTLLPAMGARAPRPAQV
ncbi:MFS transporter [Sphingomonas sp. RB3P16]|uniref:MFS transporter n=1 Tax=Parasphingomonas frigoris TaxID=3096163 RepID=UPI002FCB237A